MKKVFLTIGIIICLTLLCPTSALAVTPEDIVVLLEPSLEYDSVYRFHEGLAAVGNWDDMCLNIGYVDKSGKVIIPLDHSFYYTIIQDTTIQDLGIPHFSEGMMCAPKKDKWGYYDKTGRLMFEYFGAGVFSEGLAAVLVGDWETGKLGYINKTGKEVISPKYDGAMNFSEGLAAIRVGDWETGKWGYIDTTGKEVISPKYDWADSFYEGLAAIRVGDWETGKWGYIDKTGKEVIPLVYDVAGYFSEGLAAVGIGDFNDGKFGYIDKTGNIVIPFIYELHLHYGHNGYLLPNFSEGLAAIRLDNYDVYIDKNGKSAFTFEYEDILNFSEGLAAVRVGGKWGYIDKNGKTVVPFEYNGALSFSEGLAWVKKDGLWGIIANTTVAEIKNPGDYPTMEQPMAQYIAKMEAEETIAYISELEAALAKSEEALAKSEETLAKTEAALVEANAALAETEATALSAPQEAASANSGSPLLPIAITAIVLLGAGAAFMIYRKRKPVNPPPDASALQKQDEELSTIEAEKE